MDTSLINEICLSLKSEKISIRKKGRKDCEDIIIRNNTIISSNSQLTSLLISSLIEYEIKEIDSEQIKGKKLSIEIAQFMKKCIKYIINYSQLGPNVVSRIIDHALVILNDDSLPQSYKDEYKIIIVEFLDNMEVSHNLPFHGNRVCLQSLFYHLKGKMLDNKSICETMNLRLLKILCKALYLDDSSDPAKVLVSIINWFKQLHSICEESVSIAPLILSSTIIDCCLCFLHHQNINMIPIIINFKEFIFELTIKQLSSLQQRENQRNSFINFLLLLFNIMNNYDSCFPMNIYNLLSNYINQLNIILLSADSLRNLMLHANLLLTISKQQSKDNFVFLLNDNKICTNFRVIAYTIYYNSRNAFNNDNNSNIADTIKSTSNRNDSTQSNKKPRLSYDSTVLDEIDYNTNNSVNDIINKIKLKVTNSNNRNSLFNGSFNNNTIILESWIYILIVLCKEFTNGNFLIISEEKKTNCDDEHVINYNFAMKLNKVLNQLNIINLLISSYINSSGNHNTQLIGAILKLSIELCHLTNRIIKDYELFIKEKRRSLFCDTSYQLLFSSYYNIAKIIEDVKAEWTYMYTNILNYFKEINTPKVKKNSLLELFLKLNDNILYYSLFQSLNFNDNDHHWSLSVINNIAFKDNIMLFSYLSSIMSSTGEDIPLHINKNMIRFAQQIASSDLKLNTIINEISDLNNMDNESCQGILYFILFCVIGLMDRSPENSANILNNVVNSMDEVASSIESYIRNTVLLSFNMAYIVEIDKLEISLEESDDDSSADYIFDRESEWFRNQNISLSKTFEIKSFPINKSNPIIDNANFIMIKSKLKKIIFMINIVSDLIVSHNHLFTDEANPDSSFHILIISLFVLDAISIIIEISDIIIIQLLENKNDNVAINKDFNELKLQLVNYYNKILEKCLTSIHNRFNNIKLKNLSEYFQVLMRISIRIRKSVKKDFNNSECGNLLKSLLIIINAQSFNQISVVDDIDFDMEKIGTQGLSAQKTINKNTLSNVDNDDFMEIESTNRRVITSNVNKKLSSQNSSDDMFNCATPQFKYKSNQHSSLVRSAYSNESMSCYISVSQLLYLLSSSSRGENKALQLFGVTESSGRTSKVITNSKYYLLLADGYAKINCSDYIEECFGSCSWHVDWGVLGYKKVLTAILHILKEDSLWKEDVNDSLIEYFINLLIPSETFLQELIQSYWQLRVLQLKAISYFILSYKDINIIKNKISEIFLQYVSDADLRVRLVVCSKLPILLKVFKNTEKVYNSLIEATGVSMYPPQSSFDDKSQSNNVNERNPWSEENSLFVYTAAIAISIMGRSYLCLLSKSLLDLMRLCSSRSKYSDNYDLILYNELLEILLTFISKYVGYRSPTLLVTNHFRYIAYYWLSESDINNTTNDVGQINSFLTLEDFPYKVIYNNGTFIEFLNIYKNLFLPVISKINCPRRRWFILIEFIKCCGLQGTDGDIASTMKNNIYEIKALEISISIVEARKASDNNNTVSQSIYIQQFVERVLTNPNDIYNNLNMFISDSVQSFFTLLCYVPIDNLDSVSVSDHSDCDEITKLENYILEALKKNCQFANVNDISLLLKKCNILEFLSYLRCRLLETKTRSVGISIISSVKVIVSNLPFEQTKVVPHSILCFVKDAFNLFPELILLIASILSHLVSFLCMANYDIRSTASRSVLDILKEIFAEYLCLFEMFDMVTETQTNQNIFNNCNHKFTFQYYYELFEYYSDKIRYHDNVLNFSKARYLIKESFDDIITFCANKNYQRILSPCFPLPAVVLTLLNHDSKSKLLTNKWEELGNEILFGKMKYFNKMVQNILSGEKILLSSVWIQMSVIHSKLLLYDIEDTWENYSELISEFVSCITGLFQVTCIVNESSDWTTATGVEVIKDPFYSIRRLAVSLLGLLGPPDILSLKHNDFPFKLKSNIMSESNYDVVAMKINLIKKLYTILWDDPISAREASHSLRSMNLSGEQFSNCLTAANYRKEDSPYLNSIIEFYRIPQREKELYHKSVNTYLQYHIFNCSSDIKWSIEDIWNTHSKSPSSWLCLLCYYLIRNFIQSNVGVDDINSQDINLSIPSQSRGKKYPESYLQSLRYICLLRYDISKECFPLIVQFIINTNGIGSSAVQSISDRLNKFVLNSDCNIEMTRIGVKLLTFLLTHDIRQFLREKKDLVARNYQKVEVSKVMEGAVDDGEWKLPYSFILSIDFKYAAAAAIRCNRICSALLFAELSHDTGYYLSNFSRKIPEDLNSILIPVYKVIHDAHAIYGLDLTSSLPLQALMFSEKGNWMEALLSYESAFQSQGKNKQKESEKMSCAAFTSGVVKSLYGLGALATLSLFANPLISQSDNDAKKLLDESVWRLGKNALNSLQSWSLPGDNIILDSSSSSSSGSVTKLQSTITESINRNIAVTIDHISKLDIKSAVTKIDSSADSLFNDILRNIHDETASNVIKNISQAQQLIELRDVCCVMNSNDNTCSDKVLLRWSTSREGSSQGSKSSNTESQLALRSRLLQQLLLLNKASPLQVLNCMNKMYPDLKSKEFAFSTSPILYKFWSTVSNQINIEKPENMEFPSFIYTKNILQASSDLQESKLLWKKGLRDIAITNISRNVIERLKHLSKCNLPDDTRKNLLSGALRLCGEWISTRRAATGTEIMVEYLKPAEANACSDEERIKAYITLAAFNSRLYHNVKEKVSSEEWKQGGRVLNDRIKEYEKCKVLQSEVMQATKRNEVNPDHDGIDIKALYRHTATLKKEIDLDTNERTAVEESIQSFLEEALSDYSKVLQLSCEDDLDLVFSFVNLWLSNSSDQNVNNIMNNSILKIPSYKFIPLTYQILSRLGNSLTDKVAQSKKLDFQSVLAKVVYKICCEHPYHTLPQLFALTNERDLANQYDGAEQFLSNTSNSRFEKANQIVQQLKETNTVSSIVTSTQILLTYYIELAQCSTESFQKSGRTRDIKFKEMQNRDCRFNECVEKFTVMPAVLTLQQAIKKSGNYNEVVKIHSFLPNFSITEHGISRPKIIICIGSDGKYYKQLVKGGDDMRQDAVMEQVFETGISINYTLGHDSETRKKKLKIRTYKIVPTTPQTGVLQWVENTQAFGGILADRDKGLHSRYYPDDWTHSECRNYLKETNDNDDKLLRFNTICTKFNPAFRFFFIENFCDPTEWVTARLAYVRSVAINSVVGYILGIGDRHAHNILVDTLTGEVVHIDFGIVYEQGKGLGTPETVPFRLTRNIVDGMGVTGWEGTFRKTCEEVLRVLRDNTQQIMVILEVVMHDPLYKWSLSPLQARMKQKSVSEYDNNETVLKGRRKSIPPTSTNTAYSVNENKTSFGKDAAERTLIRIKNKLQGLEDPTGEALGIEGQIDFLINEARSHRNLCKLFPGWAPWL